VLGCRNIQGDVWSYRQTNQSIKICIAPPRDSYPEALSRNLELHNNRSSIGGDLGPSLGERKKLSGRKFLSAFFVKIFPFLRRKFLMTIFRILPVFTVWNVTESIWHYMVFSWRENPLKKSLMTPFLLSSYFRTHPPTTILLEILGGRMHGPSPTSKFGVTVPSVPPKSPPMRSSRVRHTVI